MEVIFVIFEVISYAAAVVTLYEFVMKRVNSYKDNAAKRK